MKKIFFIFFTLSLVIILSGISTAQYDNEYERALQSYNSGHYEEAVRLFKDYVKKKPDASAYYRIGYALYKLGQQDESRKYYDEAYLISPDFSPEQLEEPPVETGRPGTPRMAGTARGGGPIMLGVTPEEPEVQVIKEEPVKEIQPWVPQRPEVAPEEPVVQEGKAIPAEKPEIKPQVVEMPPLLQKEPVPFDTPQLPAAAGLAALIAGFGIFAVLVEIAIIIYVLLCLYLIAKKLDVPAAWLAWIPIVNIWVVIKSAGLKWWWILVLIFVPIPIMFLALLGPAMFILVFILITALYIYPWMLISENLGRNRLLGLLMILPLVNFIFMGVLAFSRSESEHLDLTVNE